MPVLYVARPLYAVARRGWAASPFSAAARTKPSRITCACSLSRVSRRACAAACSRNSSSRASGSTSPTLPAQLSQDLFGVLAEGRRRKAGRRWRHRPAQRVGHLARRRLSRVSRDLDDRLEPDPGGQGERLGQIVHRPTRHTQGREQRPPVVTPALPEQRREQTRKLVPVLDPGG